MFEYKIYYPLNGAFKKILIYSDSENRDLKEASQERKNEVGK